MAEEGGGGWLSIVHTTLDAVGTVAGVLPGAGTVVAAVADGINAGIYLAEAAVATTPEARNLALQNATVSAVSMVPLGRVAGKLIKGAAKTKHVAKHADKLVKATEEAKVAFKNSRVVQGTEKVVVNALSHPGVAKGAQVLDKVVTKTDNALIKAGTRFKSASTKVRPRLGGTNVKSKPMRAALKGMEPGSKEASRVNRILKENRHLKGSGKMPYVSKADRAKWDISDWRKGVFDDVGRLRFERNRLLSRYGPDALPLVKRMEAEFFRRRASSSLVYHGKAIGKAVFDKVFPVKEILTRATWNWAHGKLSSERMLEGDGGGAGHVSGARIPQRMEAQARREAIEFLRARGIELDAVNISTDQLIVEAMLQHALEQVATAPMEGGEEQNERVTAPAQQWPTMAAQMYSFLNELAGFLPPKYQPVATLILKVGGVSAGVEQLTPETVVGTLLPFIPNPDVQKVVGTLLKLRSLQQQIASLQSAGVAGSLDAMQSAMGVISSILGLIPGIPPEILQAVQLVSALLKLAHLLSIGAPPLMVLTALLSVIKLSMGFGSKTKMVAGGTNDSGQGQAHNRPGGAGPEIRASHGRPGGPGNGMQLPGGDQWSDQQLDGPPSGYQRQQRGSSRVEGAGLHSRSSDGSTTQYDDNGDIIEMAPPEVELQEIIGHIANSMGLGTYVTTDEEEYRRQKFEAPEATDELEGVVQNYLQRNGKAMRDTTSLHSTDYGNQMAALNDVGNDRPLPAETSYRPRAPSIMDPSSLTHIDPTLGDEDKSEIYRDPVEKEAEPTLSADVSVVVASELALLADPATEEIFWAKYINQALVSQSLMRTELKELADREDEEQRIHQEAAEEKRQRELAEDAARRDQLYREWEESLAKEEKERREQRIQRERQRTIARLREDAEAQARWHAQQRAAAARQQQSKRKKKKKGGCTTM